MVRFIIYHIRIDKSFVNLIYIPIWLDLLLTKEEYIKELTNKFTFQYGQIYYKAEKNFQNILWKIYIPIWLDLLFGISKSFADGALIFTFQYGQIYYEKVGIEKVGKYE